MKTILKYALFLTAFVLMAGCEQEDYEFGEIVAPSNLEVTAQIIGQDADNPYGDGSGEVQFTATADDVITYKFILNGTEKMAPSGQITHPFTTPGINTYTVSIMASGKAGSTTSTTITVEVFSECTASDEVLMMLTDNSSKTWRIKAETAGHFGVGPAEETSPIWWSAAPFDKDGLGAYDDRWTFNIDGSYTHMTNGTAYGQAGAMDSDFGVGGQTPNADGEYENYPLDDYSGEWSSCGLNGIESITFGNLGYHGFYVGGDHSYQIISITNSELSLKTVGADGNAWFVIFTSEE